MNFEELKKVNYKKIDQLKEEIKNSPNNDKLIRQLEINQKIDELLDKERAMFFKLKMEEAVKIISQVVGKEEAEKTYLELISPDEYSNLRDDFLI